MLLDAKEVAQLKKKVDLRALIEGSGVALAKDGRRWVGPCPFHENGEGTLALNSRTRVWTCDACADLGSKADVLTFLRKREGCTAEVALERLRELANHGANGSSNQPGINLSEAPRSNLLARVAEYYRQRLKGEPHVREKLRQRGIASEDTLKIFCVGFCDGSLPEALAGDGVRDDLAGIGLVNDDGEVLAGTLVVPLWDLNGNCSGMLGCGVDGDEPRYVVLPGHRGLINWRAAARSDTMVFCHSVLDALALHQAGVESVVPLQPDGFGALHAALLECYPPREIVLCSLGAADPGATLAARLRERAAVRVVELPDGAGSVDLVAAGRGDELRRWVLALPPESPATPTTSVRTRGPELSGQVFHGFVLERDERRYHVRGLAAQGLKLHATVKVWREGGSEDEFELSTLDLHSGRSRRWFATQVATLLGITDDVVRLDLNALVRAAEEHVEQPPAEVRIEVSEEDQAEALVFLRSPRLLDEILSDYETLGFVGEDTNKLLGYLVGVSRKLDAPLSLMVQSRSGAGKSALQDSILAFVPEEDFQQYSRITDQALFYENEDALVHRLLAVEETTGVGGAAYSIRAIQSSNALRIATTGKDPLSGRMRTEEYVVRGPVGVLMTTTQSDFDEETLSRFLCVSIDESSEMTRQILLAQRQAETIEGILRRREGERVRRRHHNAQRLLERLLVANPFAPKLVFPSERLVARRDHCKYLGLIRAVTLLHQHQREKKTVKDASGEEVAYVEATLDDVACANRIAAQVLAHSSADLTPQGRRLLALVRQMLTNGGSNLVDGDGVGRVTRRRVREYTGWSDWQVRRHLNELVQLEYVYVSAGRRGREYVYEIGDEAAAVQAQPAFGLTDTAELASALGGDGSQLC